MINKILSTSLATGIVAWLKDNFKYKSRLEDGTIVDKYYIYPQNMYEGAIVDIPPQQTPALSVWLTKDGTMSDTWHEIGTVHIDVMFNTVKQRAGLSQQINTVVSALRAQLLCNPVYIMNYLQDYAPGILQLVVTSETDMSKIKDYLSKGTDTSYVFSFELKYKINIFLNQKVIWNEGYDYYSPDLEVYPQNTGVDVEYEIVVEKEQS